MGGWVSGRSILVENPATETFKPAARWTPALGDGGCRFVGDFHDLAGFGNF
jgi:hypothetical protein